MQLEHLKDTKTITREYLEKDIFPACDFCEGRPYDPSSAKGYDGKGMITPGHQTSKPMPYKQY